MASLDAPSQPINSQKAPSPVRYLETTEAYDLWSEVYDTDGNFLQALDTIEMRTLLPKFLSLLSMPRTWKLVDVGCGTGRNTLQLLRLRSAGSTVVGLEPSAKMLDIARQRCTTELNVDDPSTEPIRVHFEKYDLLKNHDTPPIALNADGIISTLVLEHVPIKTFFGAASKMLKPGGILLVTNMHSEMGGISQAGFMDPKTGEKVRPTSYAHRIEDVVSGAEGQGFRVASEVLERSVDERLSNDLGPRARKWIGVKVWFGICFRKLAEECRKD